MDKSERILLFEMLHYFECSFQLKKGLFHTIDLHVHALYIVHIDMYLYTFNLNERKSKSDVIVVGKKNTKNSHLIYMRITFFRCAKSVLSYG